MGGATSAGDRCEGFSYPDWQARLEDAFLRPRIAPEPFVMFLDEDEAARLWPNDVEPACALARAVNSRLDWAGGRAVFGPIIVEANTWRRGGRDKAPPTLPLLAVTVLAACRMHRDAQASAAAYFLRLAQVLQPGIAGCALHEVRQQLSDGFGPVAELWQHLHEWVSLREASLGASTIRDHPRLTRIGYALSQAIIRRSDRMRLTAFFAAMDLLGRGVPPAAVLLRYLRIWAARPRGLSDQFCRVLGEVHGEEMLEEHLHRLAASWDGTVASPDGRRRLDLCIVLDLDDMASRWAIPVVETIDTDELVFDTGHAARITRPRHGRLYKMEGELPPVPDGFLHGLGAKGERCTATFDAQPLVALREDASAGGWLSMPSIDPFDEHLLVARPALRGELERALGLAAEPGWRLLPDASARLLLPGTLVYRRVRLADQDAFERAARSLSPTLVQALRPDPGPRPRLYGGLPLARNLSRAHYLAGGEPSLVLPVGPEPRHVQASLDGNAQSPPFRATGFPIDLRRLGPFAPGRHELVVDGETLEFHVLDPLDEPEYPLGTTGRLGWEAACGYQGLRDGAPGPADACGAGVPGDSVEPLLLRRGSAVWLVDRHGQATSVAAPEPARCFLSRGIPAPYYVAVEPQPSHVWLVEARHGKPRPPVLLRWQEPHFAGLDEASTVVWRWLDRESTAGDRLWELYLKAWRAWCR